MTECVVDGQPADGAELCGECLHRLAARLGHVPSLVEELEVTLTRQDQVGARGGRGGKSDEPPLPFNAGASDARLNLRDLLVSWARAVAEHAGVALPTAYPGTETTEAASWLLGHPGAVRHHPAAGDLYEELTEVISAAFKVIDRPADTIFAGRCECGSTLNARPGRELVACRTCGLEYHVQDRRDWMLEQLAERRSTAAEASKLLAGAGVRVSALHIDRLRAKGILFRDKYEEYRVGDVVQALAHKGRTA